MKIGYLGMGAWGFCLASLLAAKGYELTCWTTKQALADRLNQTREHPSLPGHIAKGNLHFTTDLKAALIQSELLIESVTSAGLRPVLEKVKAVGPLNIPLIMTSKGIEQGSGLILPDVAIQTLGPQVKSQVGFLSGPGFAEEVIRNLPTSVVGSAYDPNLLMTVCQIFTTPTFRVYPNADIHGVAFGGALKNIIAIACGICEGLGLGNSSKAALMTRGLHEIRKLAVAQGCKAETLNGLSGMGDLFLTCSSFISRNFRFGHLMTQGLTPKEAQDKIGMVVEGAYTCVSALQLSEKLNVSMPITKIIHEIIYKDMKPQIAVNALMERAIKEEHL
ncbi:MULTISPECIES: NAD(P)H-dependent glycerol-3-phosphate dehydrogenase [Parachlamydia]|jgi:glycerol-3-phosphate dehydrogenase (NAD(P)+)|uniref:Glycerol-3-phosphate dehydrogenase [NAD(P)+] n=2 Tax=Parachlamydia acanthamoebae TaxID=83552 RepID=F8KX65_PARAV|nr:NAD(P)H-dependent glycerol-3-phosphate dehydrogenase [Parachlamydia acanthamoebae]EFB41553.1 NAD(P)H-dependent glycerol-3-phosphate dehydrogenase [Parachlamydia acanthamoebae str. Hall's coccus]CCB85532.1 glycerol-3-phosphate dehydrogenase [NAD(P)+] [Parachlamydia acanthamoebae UV-7]